MRPNHPNDRIVFILQGVSGAGKSTLALRKQRLNAENGVRTTIVSADTFFVQADGSYVHDREKLPEAHSACYRLFCAELSRGTPVVIVDNTNTTEKQRAPYVEVAVALEYDVVHILVGSLDPQFLEFAATRSVHQKDVNFTKLVAAGYQKPDKLVVIKDQLVGFRR